jgi:hypothetical protein
MKGIEGAGALMLVDAMITMWGLEETLEDIRAVNRLNANFSKSEKKEIKEAWEGLLSIAVMANKKVRTA